ncbi:MAG: hypothetical protein ACI9XP_001200 [Lentimonas sp.]
MRIKLLILFFLPFLVFSQRPTKMSRSEFGFLLGGTYYIGDLNPFGHFKNMEPAGAIIYRFNVHSRLALRAHFMYGSISGSDSDSKYELHRNRNLSFQSDIYEAAGGIEFNYWPYQIGHKRYKATAYFLVEMGVFYFNPKTEYNGEMVSLRDLGTEGQGTPLSESKKYSRVQFTMPVGLGFRCNISKNVSMHLELGIRKTFTDYLDDVGADQYVNQAELLSASGQTSAALSNRSNDQSRFGKRGDSSTKDWYGFTGIGITFRLGQPKKCFFGLPYNY